jgi:phosphoribosyl 1,2-cyclic phosphodiesterase
MLITCWGARGSIPVSGKEYVKNGGDTTCMEIRSSSGDIIIIDAGSGIRKLGIKLLAEGPRAYHLLFTHAHWDHVLGLPFFKPIYLKGTSITMYGCPFTHQSLQAIMAKSMTAPYFPVEFHQVPAAISFHETCGDAFEIGSVRITPINLSHPNQGLGYKLTEDGKSFVFLTDNELAFTHPGGREYQDYLRFSAGADLLIHDAEYTEEQYKNTKGWGHSLYTDALGLALEAGVKQFGLFHHNQERTDAALGEIVEDCRRRARKERSGLRCFAATPGKEIKL